MDGYLSMRRRQRISQLIGLLHSQTRQLIGQDVAALLRNLQDVPGGALRLKEIEYIINESKK